MVQEMISSSLKDMEGSGKAFQALALAHQRIGDDEKSVTFLENFLKMATSTNNLRGQGDACSNLGVILSRRRQYKVSRSTLPGGRVGESRERADRSLLLVVVMPDPAVQMAVTNFQRKYEISRDMVESGQGKVQELAEAQIYLGISRGNALLSGYLTAVTYDVNNLLDWKVTHNEQKIPIRK